MNNFSDMMKQAQEMQKKMKELQEGLANLEVEGSSGGGLVSVKVNGKGEVKKIKIDPSLMKPEEVEILEDLIVAAFNEAKKKAEEASAEEMKKMTGGMNFPPGFKLPF
ncbi:MAG TPA: YbaB/EbfC family nucleoid-associated protein [Candidatus Dadabacteria bacterium]|nr:YbaB/EbfC family nucleoid-associated protein [Candidatus Dadabacteria bacterium]